MTAKQKKMLFRIIAAAVVYIAVNILMNVESFQVLNTFPIKLIIFLVPYAIIGWDIAYKAVRNILNGQVFDENFLMFIATIGAFVIGEYMEAVAVMLFYQVGELFQDYAVNKSRQSIAQLMDICPEYANVEVDGKIEQVDPDDVEVGTVIVVKAGERIPLDGVVVEGDSMVDTSSLTGESVPRHVSAGDEIISGCVNGSGVLYVRTTKAFDDSTVAKILELVENASSRKAKVENFITRFARYYTPFVVCAAVVLAVVPPIFLGGWFDWLKRACIFLVISCPCALVISVPLSFFGGIGAASKNGILVKGSNFLEAVAKLETIVFDKTGTLTKGEFAIQEIIPVQAAEVAEGVATFNRVTEGKILELAAHAESFSDHPVALSVKNAFASQGGVVDIEMVSDCEEISGHGIKVKVDGETVIAGNEKLMIKEQIKYVPCHKVGTLVYIAKEGVYMGCIVIADTVKEEA
ncbi:MAG: heavy metal translocating P-type ATPase, partial [Lachnospira sp.]|nr:heavy metal translocating P-type ATPase [Lachnospira sp.]